MVGQRPRCIKSLVLTFVALCGCAFLVNAVVPPNRPRAPREQPTSKNDVALTIEWDAPVSSGPPITAYEVSYRQLGMSKWIVDSTTVKGVPGERHREIQEVRTRADAGQKITAGYFKLSMNFEGYTDFLPENPSRTPALAWDASAEEVKDALEDFGNIGVVEVRRYGPDSQNGFVWKVTFDWERFVRRGNLPMLVVSDDALDVTWSAGGGPVVVVETRRGTDGPTICYTGVCDYRVGGLMPYTQYQFRVRALNTVGWSGYSGASKVAKTLQSAPPPTPAAPTLASASTTQLTVRLPIIPPSPAGTPPVDTVEVQYQLVSNTQGSWTSVPAVMAHESTVTAAPLTSSTEYRFRVRLLNSMGAGAWSVQSAPFRTEAAPPPPPLILPVDVEKVKHNAVALRWEPAPASLDDPPVTSYQVQYRVNQEDWRLAARNVNAVVKNSVRAIQEVQTRSDPGSIIDSGSFTLSFNFEGASDFDPSTATRTGLLPYNADASVVEAELRQLLPLSTGVEVRRKGPDSVGGYRWQVTVDWDTGVAKSGVDVRTGMPPLIANSVALGGQWTAAGSGVVVNKVRDAAKAELLKQVDYVVGDLPTSTLLQFRVRAMSAAGTSSWSIPTNRVRTLAPPPLTDEELALQPGGFPNITIPLPPLRPGSRLQGGNGRRVADGAGADPDYMAGVGVGGTANKNGGPGLVVLTSYLYNQGQVDKVNFQYQDPLVYRGRPQIYVVPESPVKGATIDFLDIKLWGGGGGGGSSNYSTGGAGAFVQGRLAVKTGDTLLILVGGGGEAMSGDRGGRGGFNGGGDGGDGEFGGGGGGGASTVTKVGFHYPLLVAAGGGGAGSSDYCCSHGGAASSGESSEGLGVGGIGATPNDTPRDNSGDASRARTEFNDERDLTGLTALHEHLDYGFAPKANYDVIASGGGGGGLVTGGAAGGSGSYVYRPSGELKRRSFTHHPSHGTDETATARLMSGSVQRNATQGRRLFGGRGANGKEAGGGGGGGWFGGGGGGAGVDGGGGGGGSSYLHDPALYRAPFEAAIPPAPRPVRITATSVLLEWDGVQVGSNGQLATAYTLELAHGKNSDEFTQIFFGDASARSHVAVLLRPVTMYRFRLIASDPLTGPGVPGPSVAVVTTSIPTNSWSRPMGRAVGAGRAGAGRRAVDAPTAEVAMLPSPMQGTTLTPLLGYGFLFGGRSAGEDCDQAVLQFCRHRAGVRNDLWRVDPVTNAWLQIDVGQVKPPPRERHLAAEINNKLYIFAGLTDPVGLGGRGTFLNDLWRLDPDHPERTEVQPSRTVVNSTHGDLIPEGRFFRRSFHVDIDESECTTAVRVWIKLEHTCLHNVHISLNGPVIAPYREPATDWPFGERLPLGMGLGEEAALFLGGSGKGHANRNIPCSADSSIYEPLDTSIDVAAVGEVVLTFDEDAVDGIAECCEGSLNGTFRPLDSLSRYNGLPPTGEWVLNIYDGDVDGLQGRLIDWGLTFDLVPCNREYEWTEMGASTADVRPGERHDATGVVVGDSWFIWGGRTSVELSDLWRYDTTTDTWTELTLARPLPQAPALGRAAVLTPWGVMTWGGRFMGSHHLAPQTMFRLDPVDAKWVAVRPPPASDPRLHELGDFLDPNFNLNDQHLDKDFSFSASVALQNEIPEFPPRRMLHSMALFGVIGETLERGVKTPKLTIYGGYNGNTMLDDVWEMTLLNPDEGFEFNSQDFAGQEAPPGGFFIEQRYQEHCPWHHVGNSTGDSWYRGCSRFRDSNSTEVCDPQHILVRAWCDRRYQSIGMF